MQVKSLGYHVGCLGSVRVLHLLHYTISIHFQPLGSANNLKMANGFLKFILNVKRLLKILETISQGIGRFRIPLCFYRIIMANPHILIFEDSVSPYNIGEFIEKVLKETTNLTMGYAHI